MSKVVQFMLSKRSLPILLLVLGCGIFIAFRTLGLKETPPTKYEKILRNVGEMLTQVHYSPKDINDKFSKEIFIKYLEAADPNKNILLQSDIDDLKKFENKIDDEILGAPVQFVPTVSDLIKKRIGETEKLYKELLAQPFDFTVDETVISDPKKLHFLKTESERKDAWRKRLKYLVLDRYVDLVETQEKNKGKEDFVQKSNQELEKDARTRVSAGMERMYNRLKFKVNDDDRFSEFVNIITNTMDPHTTFFPPVDKRYFDEQMSGRFFGIGAILREEEGNIKIGPLLTGSPAWKTGEVQAGDIVLKVAQGAGEPVDLTGYAVEDAVKLIRGKKGTEVKLTLQKSDGAIKVVSIIRDEIVQDETFARSVIVNNGKSKMGYIFLPEFYADFENPKGARSFEDVRKEVIKLKAEKVEGLIIDLRNNGGGSLYDVVQMAGLFIEDGPIVQVKDRDGKPSVLRDRDKSVLYDGPLAVMVNEFSASASEIFAAAIQDYKRGIIIGSTSTYGKGTVQRNIGLDKDMGFMSANSELGTIKLTLQKFYRINGGSTQLKGVHPDIILPDFYEYFKIREKDDPDALPWDEIQRADFNTWKSPYNFATIQNSSASRVGNNSAFNLIKTSTQWLAKQNDKVYSLKLDKFREEKKAISTTTKQLETVNKLLKELIVNPVTGEENKFSGDKDKEERIKTWMKNLRNDIYLDEAVNIVNDMVQQQHLAIAK
ncbi:MAG: carboxy terminal-processing peptidase [Chitinophagaceae bacterium]